MKNYTVKQHSIFGCGLACIKSLSKFLDIPINTILNNSKKQMTFLELINTLSEIGIKSKGFELDSSYLNKIKKPFIAHLKIGFVQHYVVVYKNYNNNILIMDPSIGRMLLIKNKYFLRLWTKKAIVLD